MKEFIYKEVIVTNFFKIVDRRIEPYVGIYEITYKNEHQFLSVFF